MTQGNTPEPGSIVWQDLTVGNASAIRDFYAKVVGWEPKPVCVGDYEDFNMTKPASGETAGGICHALGVNANLPPQWLIYISVADLDQSIADCKKLGGQVIDGVRKMGRQRFCVIRDPAGAVAGLIGD